jgi:hypothetical protein
VVQTSPEFVVTSSASATTANVPLSATIRDVADQSAGDIRNARVTFVIPREQHSDHRLHDLTPGARQRRRPAHRDRRVHVGERIGGHSTNAMATTASV